MIVVSATNTAAAPAPLRRLRAKASVLLRLPEGAKPSLGASVMTIPVKDWSNCSMLTFTTPRAGSLITALPPRKPSSTTKWSKSQWMMQGKVAFSRSASSSMR